MPKSSEAVKMPAYGYDESSVQFPRLKPGTDWFCSEAVFHEKLLIERQRTDRSGRPFLLMLINLEFLLKKNKGAIKNFENVENKLIEELNSLTRQTDFAGWFAHQAVIGVIFTELGSEKQSEIRETLLHRVKDYLADVLVPELLSDVRISFHFYPMDFDPEKDSSLNLYFYPGFDRNNKWMSTALWFKRALDIVGSITGLILFFPCFLLITALVKITSPGPVFFRQKRLGFHGKPFMFLKFRTMTANNDASIHRDYIKSLIENNLAAQTEKSTDGGQVYKIANDPRVTRVGRFLRKTSLDEIPQFINVLKGEMSLIGPRPPIPYEFDHYQLWHRRRVMEVKPGITGLWQVKGRSRCNFDETVRLDLQYIREWSLWLDIKILFQTPWAMIAGKGGY